MLKLKKPNFGDWQKEYGEGNGGAAVGVFMILGGAFAGLGAGALLNVFLGVPPLLGALTLGVGIGAGGFIGAFTGSLIMRLINKIKGSNKGKTAESAPAAVPAEPKPALQTPDLKQDFDAAKQEPQNPAPQETAPAPVPADKPSQS